MTIPLIHTPLECAKALSSEVERITSGRASGYPTGLGTLDNYIPGLVRPQEICFFLARPGHAKSIALRQTARVNAFRGTPVLTVECEMSVEDQEIREASFFSGEDSADILSGVADWDAVAAVTDWRENIPIYTLGYSRLKADEIRAARQKKRVITVETISDAIDEIRTSGTTIEIVCIDYLQMMRPGRLLGDIRKEIIDVIRDSKSLAQYQNVAVFMGVQAKREVDARKPPIPRRGDGAESSEIEKAADYIVSLVYFPVYYEVGQKIPGFSDKYVRRDELFALIDKQRMGKPNIVTWLKFKPENAVLFAAEEEWVPPYQKEGRDDERKFYF